MSDSPLRLTYLTGYNWLLLVSYFKVKFYHCRPVIIEIPHFASMRGVEREIQVLRSDDGKKWEEHKLQPTDDVVFKAVNDSFDGRSSILMGTPTFVS